MANAAITYELLDNAYTQIGQGKQSMNDTLTSLNTLVQTLTGDGFQTDKASQTFYDSFTKFTASLTAAVNDLENMQNFLTTTKQNYSDLDTSLQGAASQLH